jgi:hypothetical protein
MKKIILLSALLVSALTFSQITLTRHNLTPITNGQVIAFNTIAYPAAELDFYVKNIGTTQTRVKLLCSSLVNTDGSNFELCFGPQCLSYVEEGEVYPTAPYGFVTLNANQQLDNSYHFLNTVVGSAPYPKDYTFRFYQVNATGVEISNSITVTYRYDPNLSTDDINQLQDSGVVIKSTVIDNELTLDVIKDSTMEVFNFDGKVVLTKKLTYGMQTVDTSNLSSGVYIVNFTDTYGNTSTKKVIKK